MCFYFSQNENSLKFKSNDISSTSVLLPIIFLMFPMNNNEFGYTHVLYIYLSLLLS